MALPPTTPLNGLADVRRIGVEWTKERLAALSHDDRHNVWENAKRLGAEDLVKFIVDSGLPYIDPKGLKLDRPLGRKMSKIINSPQGVAAALTATENGMPALAGIDPMLKAVLKKEYADSHEATIQAGYLVALMMRKKGYEQSGKQGSIQDCVAKIGLIYTRVK
jgi:hypothetical protein